MLSSAELSGARVTRGRPRMISGIRLRAVPADLWAVLALTLLAAVIRLLVIDNQSFWTDESLTVLEARSGFGTMLNYVRHVETTPPLYFVLIWGWAKLWGTSETALRSISAIAGVSLVPIAYLAAREVASRRAGVLAAALVAVNPFMVWYSQEARAYMLLAAFTGAGFLCFLRAWREPTWRRLGWWAAFSSLAVTTHFFAGFAIAPEALWLLWSARSRRVVGAVGAVAIVQLAMLPFALSDVSHGVGWITQTPRLTRIAQTTSEWGASQLFRRVSVTGGLIALGAMIALVAALLVFGGERGTRERVWVVAGVAGLMVLVPLGLGFLGQDYFISRNLIAAFLPVVVVIACACTMPRARVLGGLLAMGLLALFAVTTVWVQTHPFLQRPQWRVVAASLGGDSQPRAILAAGGTTADPLKIYLPGVRWAQSPTHAYAIDEVDVIGARKRFKLGVQLSSFPPFASSAPSTGSVLPRSVAPPGTRLLERRAVHNWVIARFALDRPRTLSIDQLQAMAPLFLRRTPSALLVFLQHVRNLPAFSNDLTR